MLKQFVDLPGVANARELGGYAIKDKHVRRGILLRTGDLSHATPEALIRLHDEYEVQTIIDFRMSTEHVNLLDPQVPESKNLHLTVVEMQDYPIPEDMDPRALDLLNDPTANRMQLFDISYECGVIGSDSYDRFLLGERGKKAYAAFFRELFELKDGRAILWHCTDGKDRTGCAAMLLLSALGASRELVIEDYLLTNDYNATAVKAVEHAVATNPMPQDKADALLFMSGGVAESYMAHALDMLDKRYGSVEGYLREELDVGAKELDLLRSKFLV